MIRMFLSRIKLNTNLRKTQLAFASPNLFHGAVERCFNERQERNLWRIDKLSGQYHLMILSKNIPSLENLEEQFGYKGSSETKPYDGLLDRIENGQKWRFRLVANPTNSIKNNGKKKILAHVSEKYQLEWLTKKADQHGFKVDDVTVMSSGWKMFKKHGDSAQVRLKEAAFEGVLTVKDVDAFRNALMYGIGRGKVYGMGMLTVVSMN